MKRSGVICNYDSYSTFKKLGHSFFQRLSSQFAVERTSRAKNVLVQDNTRFKEIFK